MSGTGAIIISIAIIAVIAWASIKSKKRLREEGKIIEREAQFYKNRVLFNTTATYPAVVDKMSRTDYSDIRANIQTNVDGKALILIRSAYEWEATLAHIDEQDGKNDFDFHFTSWKTENGRPKNDISMNMLLTSIEKMFYELDPQATMEMHKMQFSTKTSFF